LTADRTGILNPGSVTVHVITVTRGYKGRLTTGVAKQNIK